MNYSADHDCGRTIAPEQQRCVWMTAGILSYQLCDRQFDCEHCPLDQAMRMSGTARAKPDVEREDTHTNANMLLYSTGHCWVERLQPHVARIGIEPMLAAMLISPKAIVFPSVGQEIKPHDSFCWFVVEGTTLQLQAPIGGEIQGINSELLNNPQDICKRSPFRSMWLLDMNTIDPVTHSVTLMSGEEIQHQYDLDAARFNKLLSEELRPDGSSAVTLHDGGVPMGTIPDGLSVKQYYSLLRTAFRL